MNVGITRARASVLVVGSASTLKHDKHWCNLVENAEQRNCLFKVSRPYTTFFSEENMNTMSVKDTEGPKGDEDEMENAAVYGNVDMEQENVAADDDYGDGYDGGDGGYDED